MDGPAKLTRVEAFNQLVRGFVVIALTLGLLYGFCITKVLSTETFVVISSVVYTWWFKSRDDERKEEKKAANGATPIPAEVKP